MKKYIITTESGSDLSKEIIDRYNIQVIPMHVTMGDQTLPDGSFDVQKAFDYFETTGNLPKTSGSSPQDNTEGFKQVFAEHPDATIIHIGYSAVTTVSFNAAKLAAQDFKHVYLVDSKHVSIGAAAIVKATAQFIEENPDTSPEAIIAFVEDVRERTHMVFLPKTLQYLKAGGRVSSLAFHGANLLKIQPSIVLENGYLVPEKKYRGSFDNCLKKMVNHFFQSYNINPDTVLIVSPPGVEDSQKEVISGLLKENGVQKTRWMQAGAVISSHGGPGAIGITGIEKTAG
ncbi:DegV family protein [Marinilactibacillus piezotolerans]|uniref:DegV family protein n=1 Tax=Marinilactibacillus piezotolerans TaxID=258723 RepID=UPI0009B05247|nr:DegV family protein [Marinilactibacillus piezotolerans]